MKCIILDVILKLSSNFMIIKFVTLCPKISRSWSRLYCDSVLYSLCFIFGVHEFQLKIYARFLCFTSFAYIHLLSKLKLKLNNCNPLLFNVFTCLSGKVMYKTQYNKSSSVTCHHTMNCSICIATHSVDDCTSLPKHLYLSFYKTET